MRRVLLTTLMLAPAMVVAKDVNVANYVRAESDHMLRSTMESFNIKVGVLQHAREATTPELQPVIRMNQDTLYSSTVIDLSEPLTVTLPEIHGRYQSMHIVNQDHFMRFETKPGTYELNQELVGTRFALVTIRTFVNPNDPEDVEKAHQAQDLIKVSGGGKGPLDIPDWNQEQLSIGRKALNDFAVLGFDSAYAFGTKEETKPVDHLIGAASGWGGLPKKAAMYSMGMVANNDGETFYSVTAKDVPVEAFWSVTVYNADGYLEANELGVNSYNNITAKADSDGAITIHFGGCGDGRINCIPITKGWNYAVRMYSPKQALLEGNWTFPTAKPAQ
ncbi:DUF1214 domain-containing protein [Thalassotalea mangrovi]|uniref:DUF1214 domain-containing protein n=1 Tax=Thalassotalea mangrovi TaxID=2572245 RepID=A0A4U1B2T4_9GAMM|nr:DUF1214 domain-containing protein [Thalassotalea mangrovi]TKB43469.1 DUF1214 domain-containing protein [Thalassotalea mangrovi]